MKKSLLLILFVNFIFLAPQTAHAYVPISDEQMFELTPLMAAIDKKDMPTVIALIKAGADVNELSESGGTALMLAARMANSEIVELLLKSGAKPDNCGRFEYCPLWYAVEGNEIGIVKMLVNAGADPTWNPYNNGTEYPPLHNAASNNNIAIVRYLVEAGADIEFTAYYSNTAASTPLAIAIAGGNLEITKYLLGLGAKIHEATEVPFYIYKSAVEFARLKGHKEVVEYIEKGLAKGKFIAEHSMDYFLDKIYKDPKYLIEREKNSAGIFLSRVSMENLRFLRNTIFARKNYAFKDKDLTLYFKKRFIAYKPLTQTLDVSDIDKANIKYLQELERMAYNRSIAS